LRAYPCIHPFYHHHLSSHLPLISSFETKANFNPADNSESPRQLTPHPNLRTEKIDKIDERAKTKRDEANGSHCPFGAHFIKHQNAEMGTCGSYDEGGDEEGGDGGGGDVGVGVWEGC
jgi:hypothetical protein